MAMTDGMALFVRYGLTPRQALQSAGGNGPGLLDKLDRYSGSRRGKAAVLRVLDADPLADRGETRIIRMVVSRGEVNDRARLDRMLEETRRKVAEKQ